MSFDPGSIISLIQTCQTLYDYFNDVKQSSVERRRLLDEVVSLQSALEALQRLVSNVGDPTSTEQLAQLLGSSQPFYEALQETLTDVEAVLRNGVPKPNANRLRVLCGRLVAALRWTADKAEVKSLLSDLERQKSRITIALQHDMFKKQDGIDGKLDNMDQHISNEDRLKIAEFISASDYTGHRIDLLEKRLSGTGTWMIQHPEFVAWRDNIEPREFWARESWANISGETLWFYGHPGAGKSVMAALIVDHLQSTSNIVLSVFCRYSSDTFTTPFPVLRGLLRQLIEKMTTVPSTICDLYWTKTTPNPDTLPGLLAEAAAVHARPIYIIIDALDECQIGIDLLHAIRQLGPSFRVLVTSRPIFREIWRTRSIEIRASDNDILIAVDKTLSRLQHTWLDKELKSTIRAKVVDNAGGMFLLASLQLRELERDVTRRSDVVAILDSLPRTLDDAYKLIFQRIREQGERSNELACRTLALVALKCLGNSYTVTVLLAEADRTDSRTILQCCHGLLRESLRKFKFIHHSVYEYTIAHWSELFPENPNRFKLCIKLGYSTLINSDSAVGFHAWRLIVREMRKPEEFDQVISLLSTPAARARFSSWGAAAEGRFSSWGAAIEPFVHDPLLIACFLDYGRIVQYMIQTAPPDVERFNEAIIASDACWWGYRDDLDYTGYEGYINERPDMQVNSDGVVVAVDPNGGEKHCSLSEVEDDETFAG